MFDNSQLLEVDKLYKMFGTKISDCNKCPYLSVTEERQNQIYIETGIKPIHFCKKYRVRVIHRCALSNKQEHYKIFPISSCDVKEIEIYFAEGEKE